MRIILKKGKIEQINPLNPNSPKKVNIEETYFDFNSFQIAYDSQEQINIEGSNFQISATPNITGTETKTETEVNNILIILNNEETKKLINFIKKLKDNEEIRKLFSIFREPKTEEKEKWKENILIR